MVYFIGFEKASAYWSLVENANELIWHLGKYARGQEAIDINKLKKESAELRKISNMHDKFDPMNHPWHCYEAYLEKFKCIDPDFKQIRKTLRTIDNLCEGKPAAKDEIQETREYLDTIGDMYISFAQNIALEGACV